MGTVKIQPAPGYLLVEPIENDFHQNMAIAIKGGKSPKKGTIVRMPTINTRLREREISPSSETLPLKIGDVILFDTDSPYTISVNGSDYQLISNWCIIAKIG